MASIYRTLTYTTGSIAAGASTSRNDTIVGNVASIVKIKVVPSNISGGELTQFQIFKHNTFLAADLVYNTVSFAGNLVDPIETDGITSTERNEGYVARYEDLDDVQQLHNKITNNGAFAKTYTVTITYITEQDETGAINIMDFGATGNGTTDDTVAIQAAYTAAQALTNGARVLWPQGTFKTTTQITQTGNRIYTEGAGGYATKWLFAPTGNSTCFKVDNGASDVFQGGLRGIAFFSDDSTYVKIAINLVCTSDYCVEDVIIGGSVTHGGTNYWSDNTNASIGIQTNGHEAMAFNRLSIAADRPIYIAKNPYLALDADHFNFNNCNLTANGNPVYQCQDNIFVQHLTIGGYQAWVKGTHGFTYHSNGSGSAGARPSIRIEGVGREQVEDATHYVIDIEMSGGDSIQNLILNDFYGPTINQGHGIKVRGINGAVVSSFWYVGNGTALDADATSTGFFFEDNSFTAVGGTFSTTGFTGFFYYDNSTRKIAFNTFDTTEFMTLPNVSYYAARNAANNASVKLMGYGANNQLYLIPAGGTVNIGDGVAAGLRLGLGVTNPSSHTIVVPNTSAYGGENAAGSDSIQIAQVDASNIVHIGSTGAYTQFDSPRHGFYNTTPAAKQTVTGSRGANAALASVLTALATIGLIVDSSS